MKRSTKTILIVIALALLPAIVKLQMTIDPQRPQFQPGKGVGSVVTNPRRWGCVKSKASVRLLLASLPPTCPRTRPKDAKTRPLGPDLDTRFLAF